jgi:hypothetical protein
MCSWESSESPKLAHRVRILASLLFVSDRISSLWSVTESHATLRRSQTRFDSWRRHLAGPLVASGSASILPASVSEARRSSKPQGRVRFPGGGLSVGTISRPRSVTDSHTTLRRSGTRFNSWRGHRSRHRFLFSIDRSTDDAGARRPGDRLQPGSSGFDSHRRLCGSPQSALLPATSGPQDADRLDSCIDEVAFSIALGLGMPGTCQAPRGIPAYRRDSRIVL